LDDGPLALVGVVVAEDRERRGSRRSYSSTVSGLLEARYSSSPARRITPSPVRSPKRRREVANAALTLVQRLITA
jgi:hypothetical protein